MRVSLLLALATALALPSLAGCVSEEVSLDGRCSSWTRNTTLEEPGAHANLHVRSQRGQQTCLEVHFGGDLAAQIPLQDPESGEPVEETRPSIPSTETRVTVRVHEALVGEWTTEAVDLEETPHVVLDVDAETVEIRASRTPPSFE